AFRASRRHQPSSGLSPWRPCCIPIEPTLIDSPSRSDAAGDTGQRLPKTNYTGRQLTGKSQLLLTKKPPLDRALSFLLLHQLKAAHVVAAVVGKRNEIVRIVFDEDQHRDAQAA